LKENLKNLISEMTDSKKLQKIIKKILKCKKYIKIKLIIKIKKFQVNSMLKLLPQGVKIKHNIIMRTNLKITG
jgi:hypothetical protein